MTVCCAAILRDAAFVARGGYARTKNLTADSTDDIDFHGPEWEPGRTESAPMSEKFMGFGILRGFPSALGVSPEKSRP
jgi:hypothetical protein